MKNAPLESTRLDAYVKSQSLVKVKLTKTKLCVAAHTYNPGLVGKGALLFLQKSLSSVSSSQTCVTIAPEEPALSSDTRMHVPAHMHTHIHKSLSPFPSLSLCL